MNKQISESRFRKAKRVLCAFLLFALSVETGCARHSNPNPPADLHKFMAANAVKYRISEKEIIKLFGEPENKTQIPYPGGFFHHGDGVENIAHEMWVYSWAVRKGNVRRRSSLLRTLILSFNREGRVIDYSLSENPL